MDDIITYENLEKTVLENNPEADIDLLRTVYQFAETFHEGQYRKSGEPYIIHPLHVSKILAEIGMDDKAIAAGLLHDVIEDTVCTVGGLADHFGEEVAFLVEGVTKLDKLECVSREERQLESYRKMFLAMAEDVRVIIIKLADRLHNMRTMAFQSPESQKRIAKETLEIYAPIADRLGIIKVKWELEDLCLRYLEPDIYYDLVDRISMKRQERVAYIDEVIEIISQELDRMGMSYEIGGRPKHFYSIYRKMVQKQKDLNEIYDLIAIRILVDTVQDCYVALGTVHSLWKPVPGRFKDYIAMPKPNLYQSLHTTVIGPRGERFEIQIRTHEMHQIAEYGVAAHWLYKQTGGSEEKNEGQGTMSWIQQLQELQNDSHDNQEFLDNIKMEIFTDSVFVFSPMGEVFEMPKGSTPIDFAYRVHTEIGNQCVGAKVNNRIVPLDYELQTGDTVEILKSKNAKGPGRNWIHIAKTSQAKNKIRSWLKKNKREENIDRGQELYEKAVRSLALHKDVFLSPDKLDQIAPKIGFKSREDLYAGIGIGSVSSTQVINRMREEYKHLLSPEETTKTGEGEAKAKPKPHIVRKTPEGISVKGMDDLGVRIADCCKPVPGDDILGYITRGHGITVHHVDCPNIANLKEEDPERFIDVAWEGYEDSLFEVQLYVEALDRPKITAEVISLINDSHVHLTDISSKSKDQMSQMRLMMEVQDLHELKVVMEKINAISDVFEVRRNFTQEVVH